MVKVGLRYCGVAFQARDETLREQGLAAAQFAFERQYRTGNKILRNLPRDCFRFSGAVGNERSHWAICDLRFESSLRRFAIERANSRQR